MGTKMLMVGTLATYKRRNEATARHTLTTDVHNNRHTLTASVHKTLRELREKNPFYGVREKNPFDGVREKNPFMGYRS